MLRNLLVLGATLFVAAVVVVLVSDYFMPPRGASMYSVEEMAEAALVPWDAYPICPDCRAKFDRAIAAGVIKWIPDRSACYDRVHSAAFLGTPAIVDAVNRVRR